MKTKTMNENALLKRNKAFKNTGVEILCKVYEVEMMYKPLSLIDSSLFDEQGKLKKIGCSLDIYRFIRPFYNSKEHIESFYTVYLNRANQVTCVVKVSQGGRSGTVADPAVIIGYALLTNASSFILVHNHPSGNRTPSEADIRLTRKLKDAGAVHEMPCLDHLILNTDQLNDSNDTGLSIKGANNYYSFADEGIM